MSILETLFHGEEEEGDLKKLVDALSSRKETIAFFEPATSGLLSYEFSETEFTSKVLAGSIVPSSIESYRNFIEMSEVEGFPHKQVCNERDAQFLSNVVRDSLGSSHGVSVLAPLNGTTRQTVYVGLNISGQQRGVFTQEFNFHSDKVKRKISKFAIQKFIQEYTR